MAVPGQVSVRQVFVPAHVGTVAQDTVWQVAVPSQVGEPVQLA